MELTKNCHIVSKSILKNFGNKLSIYNIDKRFLDEGRGLNAVYTSDYFYSQEIEDLLNTKLESRFANLMKNKLLNFNGDVELTREEVGLVKKYMAVSVARSIYEDRFISQYMRYEEIIEENDRKYCEKKGIPYKKINELFKEVKIEGESIRDYWLRSIKVLLETDFTFPQDVEKHPLVTHLAYHWAYVAMVGYIAFWDTEKEEFFITDIGMTSENEIGWSEIHPNHIKMEAAFAHAKPIEGDDINISYKSQNHVFVYQFMHENFMMFPLSGKRLLVLIHPYFKYVQDLKQYGVDDFPKLSTITHLPNEKLFAPNESVYSAYKNGNPIFAKDNIYRYKPVLLADEEVRYCNALFMDRVFNWLGFNSLKNARKSILKYKRLNKGFIPRNNYDALYEIIWKRFGEDD